jgi:adenylate kinase family enzyme
MKKHIHIVGAAGSGTTTLGKAIAKKLGYRFIDTDDYYWAETNPPYTTPRDCSECCNLLLDELRNNDAWVLSGSLVNWDYDFTREFDLVVFLSVPTVLRLERIKKRELEKHGDRILPGGDMYEKHQIFLNYTKKYDTGDLTIRSRKAHDLWLSTITCEKMYLEDVRDLDQEIDLLMERIYCDTCK